MLQRYINKANTTIQPGASHQTASTESEYWTPEQIGDDPRLNIPLPINPFADANVIIRRPPSIQTILPSGEVHLLAGPSGAGKTSAILEFIRAIKNGEPIWGYRTTPQKCALLGAHRSEASYRRTFVTRGFDISEIAYFESLVDDPNFNPEDGCRRTGANWLEGLFQGIPDDVRIVVIDPLLSLLAGDSNHFGTVSRFCIALTRIAQKRNLTIIGVVHSPKSRSKDFIYSPRERLLGSVAWSAHVETILYIESVDRTMTTASDRRLFLLPRNAPPRTICYRFDAEGRFVVLKAEEVFATYDTWLEALAPGTKFSAARRVQQRHQQRH